MFEQDIYSISTKPLLMTKLAYELIEPTDGFDEGTVFDLTAQFGEWHLYDVKLEPRASERDRSLELTWEQLRDVAVFPEEASTGNERAIN